MNRLSLDYPASNVKTFYIKTFGCQMNFHDSEKISTILVANGFILVPNENVADLIIYNTCCVREKAENKFFGQIQSLRALKEVRPSLKIAVGGCIAQNEQEDILSKLDHVDLVFGTQNYVDILRFLDEVEETGQRVARFYSTLDRLEVVATERENLKRAWVTISTGCDNFCAYCIVPFVRGRETSRPLDKILSEVELLVDQGVMEITLLGQNVNSYGADLYGAPRFNELLTRLDQIDGIERIRFTTSHPKDFSPRVIRAIASSQRICRHLHLPLQSGSDSVLAKMGRKYSKSDYLKIVDKIKTELAGVNITTDIMVGFPGESEHDFQETLDVVEKARFGNAFTFIYSPRKGTRAFNMGGEVSAEVALDRFNRLIKLQNDIGLELNQEMVGATFTLLVEGKSKKDGSILTGRTACNRVVNFRGSDDLINRFVNVKIEEARSWSLKARLS